MLLFSANDKTYDKENNSSFQIMHDKSIFDPKIIKVKVFEVIVENSKYTDDYTKFVIDPNITICELIFYLRFDARGRASRSK